MRTLDSFVLRRAQERPTWRKPPRAVRRTKFSPAGISRASFRPTDLRKVWRSSLIVRRYWRISSTVFEGIGGVRTTLGAQPIFFLISFRSWPWRPMTIPGLRAAMETSPVSVSK